MSHSERNWKTGPGYQSVQTIQLPPYDKISLSNGLPVYLLNQGSQDIIKFDLVFRGGRLLEEKKLVSKFTATLLREGTLTKKPADVANYFDYHGAVLRVASNLDFVYMSLSCLSKHFEKVIHLLAEVLYEPLFSEEELEKLKRNTIQKLFQDLSKNDLISYRVFTEAVFGVDHPYGYNSTEQAITAITRDDLVAFHKDHLGHKNAFIVVSGKFDGPAVASTVEKLFGNTLPESTLPVYSPPVSIQQPAGLTVYTNNEYQASIKIGRKLFNRQHPDYAAFFFMNTLFGGYFGSRLMSSIREKHGYTYNVYSVFDHLIYDGYFYIGTDVALEYVDATMSEINKQIKTLCSRKAPSKEIEMVRSYLTGNFLNLIDGPLNSGSLIKSLAMDFTLDGYFEDFLEKLKTVSAKDVQEMAQKYLGQEDLITTVVTHQSPAMV